MSIFSRYLVIPQYFYFKCRGMIFVNTAHPYAVVLHNIMGGYEICTARWMVVATYIINRKYNQCLINCPTQ